MLTNVLTASAITKPFILGTKLDKWKMDRWWPGPPNPINISAGAKTLNDLDSAKANKMHPVILNIVPAQHNII